MVSEDEPVVEKPAYLREVPESLYPWMNRHRVATYGPVGFHLTVGSSPTGYGLQSADIPMRLHSEPMIGDVEWKRERMGEVAPPARCPECVQGKHGNCDGTAWDDVTDAPGTCPCTAAGHQ